MVAVRSSEALANLHRTTLRHIPKDCTLLINGFESGGGLQCERYTLWNDVFSSNPLYQEMVEFPKRWKSIPS
jgi:hypothetical protein